MSFFNFFLFEKSGICYTSIHKSTKRSGEAMSEEKMRENIRRQSRVRRLKSGIILAVFLLVLAPFALCIYLAVRMHVMDRSLTELAYRVELLAQEAAASQALLHEVLGSTQTVGQGSQEENVAARELPGYELTADSSGGEELPDVSDEAVIHKVYLTFDDGPSPNTEEILDILDRYDVKATFFVVGKESDADKEALMQIVERGHSLGMHSYSHKYVEIYASVEDFATDFVKLRSYLEDVTGVTSNIYRFPGGSSNTVSRIDMQEFADYLESWDVQFFDWNVSSGDGGRILLTADTLVKNSLEGIGSRETSIILLHDSAAKPTTVQALPVIIENILAMENTVILPITEDTEPVQHIHNDNNK